MRCVVADAHGSKVASGTTATSSTSGSVRSTSVGTIASSASIRPRRTRRASAGHPSPSASGAMLTSSNAGHGGLPPALLGEPVHDRVAAVGQHDEQHPDLVVRGAPQRLDAVQRRAVPDDGDHRAPRARPSAPRSPRADRTPARPSRRSGIPAGPGRAAGGAGRDGSTGSPRRRPCRRAAARPAPPCTCAARSGSPPLGGVGTAARCGRRRRVPGRSGRRAASAAHTGGRPGDHGELHRAVVGVLDVVGDQHDRRARIRSTAPARRGTGGTPGRPPPARRRGPPARRAGGRARRAGGPRTAGGPAGSPRGRRTPPATRAPAAVRPARPGPPRCRRRRRRPRPPAPGRGPLPGGRPAPRPPPGRRPAACRSTAGAASSTSSAGRGPVVAGHDDQGGPAAVDRLVPGPRDALGTSCGRTGWFTHTGYSPAKPGEVPRQERPVDRGGAGPAGRRPPPAVRGWCARWRARRPRCPAPRWCAG